MEPSKPNKDNKEHHDNPQADLGADSSEKTVTLTQGEYGQLQARIKELEGMKESLLRSAADFENAKKRLMREREEFTKFGQENLIRDLLPVLDNLERALSHATDLQKDPVSKGLFSGVQMTAKQFFEILKNQGLKRIKALGEIFDPHHHEAIGYVEESGKPDEVVTEIEPGYIFHDRLLRATKVRVRVAPSSKQQHPPSEKEEEIT